MVAPSDVDETVWPGEAPTAYALRVARDKAAIATRRCRESGSVVIAADTVVVAEGEILGKPDGPEDARRMVKTLSGVEHAVHTAVVVVAGAGEFFEVTTSRVRLLRLTDAEVDWYIRSGEWAGKAGGYGVQGRAARFIDWLEGSWSNVVGLPVATVYRLLKATGECG